MRDVFGILRFAPIGLDEESEQSQLYLLSVAGNSGCSSLACIESGERHLLDRKSVV